MSSMNLKRKIEPKLPSTIHDSADDSKKDRNLVQSQEKLWLLVFAASAECITSGLIPVWVVPSSGLNISATLLNLVGGFLEGIFVGLEEIFTNQDEMVTLSRYFRGSFLGVFTSYSYMLDHAGSLLVKNAIWGPGYIIMSIFLSCITFAVGKSFILCFAWCIKSFEVNSRALKLWLMVCLSFVVCVFLRAFFGTPGFIRDPNDPKFIGYLQVHDGIELFLGVVMSSLGFYLSTYVGAGIYKAIDWGTWRCNVLSCLLALVAYGASVLSPNIVRNIVVLKFVSSFCGSLSCFSATVGHSMTVYLNVSKRVGLQNIILNIITGIILLPYFRQ